MNNYECIRGAVSVNLFWIGVGDMIRSLMIVVLMSFSAKGQVIQAGSKSVGLRSLAFQKSTELDAVLINRRSGTKAAVWQWKNHAAWIVMQTKNDSFVQSCEAWAAVCASVT